MGVIMSRFKFNKLSTIGNGTTYGGTFQQLPKTTHVSQDRYGFYVYTHPKWSKLVSGLRATHKQCQHCGCVPTTGNGLHADHIIELKDYGVSPRDLPKIKEVFMPESIQMLCHRCHKVKGEQARRKRSLQDLQRIRRFEDAEANMQRIKNNRSADVMCG